MDKPMKPRQEISPKMGKAIRNGSYVGMTGDLTRLRAMRTLLETSQTRRSQGSKVVIRVSRAS